MNDSIRLSPKHGVNPSVFTCFWCGQDIGVALLGRLREDEEAPRTMVIDYEPCDTCKAQRAQGFTLIEATLEPQSQGQMPIGSDDEDNPVYPTGRVIVITMEAAIRILPLAVIGGLNTALINTEGFEKFQPE